MDTERKGKYTGCQHGCTNLCLKTESGSLQGEISEVDKKIRDDNVRGSGLGFVGVKYPKTVVGAGYSHCIREQRRY